MNVSGIPEVNPPIEVEDEIQFEFNSYTNDTFIEVRSNHIITSRYITGQIKTIDRPFINISPSAPLLDPFYFGLKMEKYGNSWLHLHECELIDEDGGFQEIIVKDGCSTDPILYRLQDGESFLTK